MVSSIESNIRNDIGSNANHRLRESGYVPAVIYGKSMNTLPIEVNKREIESLVRHGGEKSLIDISIGGESYTAYIKEIQWNPVTRQIMHVDLQQVKADERIHVSIPVVLKGRAFVEKGGLVVQQQLKEVEIECTAGNIPKKLEYDITHFRPGDILKVADMEFGEEISVLDELQSVIASIATVEKVVEEEQEEISVEKKVEAKDRH